MALSRFLAKSGDIGSSYFQCLRKNEEFQWTSQCEKAFQQLKEYLSKPLVLCRPERNSVLALYVSMSEQAVNSVLVWETWEEQKVVYFVSKVLHRAEIRYPMLEKALLVVVVTTRRLRHYFHNHGIKVMMDLPIKQILQKTDISNRLVKWVVELSEYNIRYKPRSPIKTQFLSDILVELTDPVNAKQDEAPQ